MTPFRGPFTRKEAAHLLRRAAFAPSQAELDQAVAAGLEATVEKLIGAPAAPPSEVEQTVRTKDEHAPLAGVLLQRASQSAAPLRENVSLFFHNHFVSAFSKVREARMMLDQLALFREAGLGRFQDLATAVARDPAMVRYLDLERSNRWQPNENFARELLELFTMGPGPYTEQDIREAARAFTGHHLRDGRFVWSEAAHDDGFKTVLGQYGQWSGDDVVAIAANHPATPRFMSRKLARWFVADEPSERAIDEVERAWRRNGGHVGGTLREVFLSSSFFAPEHRFAVTRPPAALISAAARVLGFGLPPLAAARACFAMGQSLGDPPSVKGYPGGARWLNAATLLARRSFLLETLREARKQKALRPELVAAATASSDAAFGAVLGRGPFADEAAVLASLSRSADRVGSVLEVVILHPLFQRC